jgi:hypothetical protein
MSPPEMLGFAPLFAPPSPLFAGSGAAFPELPVHGYPGTSNLPSSHGIAR